MYYFNKYTLRILDQYKTHLELIDSIAIGFTGVASQRVAPIYSNEVDADSLFFAANLDFSNAGVLVRIRSVSPQYQWMANNLGTPQDTPVGAIFGVSTQILPCLPLVMPFFVKRNGKIQMDFTNAAAAPITGGVVTWRILKLVDPIGGGWDYGKTLSGS